jgi:hypothetical protein
MPKLQTDQFNAGDQSWLGGTHAIYDTRTETLDPTAFTAGTHYPNGYIKSGTPLAKVGGFMVPYTSAEGTTTGAGVLAGHLYTDQKVVGNGKIPVPVLDHGRVKSAKVPQGSDAFTVPVAAAKRAAMSIIYI